MQGNKSIRGGTIVSNNENILDAAVFSCPTLFQKWRKQCIYVGTVSGMIANTTFVETRKISSD